MPTILILDREPVRRQHLVDLVQAIDPGIIIEAFIKPEPALSWMQWNSVDLVISDSLFPDIRIDNLIRRMREQPGGKTLPLLVMAPWGDQQRRRDVLDAGATDLLATPLDDLEFHARCGNLLTQRHQQHIIHKRARWLEKRVSEVTSEIRQREHETLLRLAKAGEYRDEETGNHVIRMARYSRLIAEQLGLAEEECEAIELAAPMHDIGKIGIPDSILLKKGRLNEDEWHIMRKHPVYGAEIIGAHDSALMNMAQEIALSHHEKWDGSGYPNGLEGEAIPLSGRIIAIADVFDALTTERPYKQAWSVEDAVQLIDEGAGTHFDPQLIPILHSALPEFLDIRERYEEGPAPDLEQQL